MSSSRFACAPDRVDVEHVLAVVRLNGERHIPNGAEQVSSNTN